MPDTRSRSALLASALSTLLWGIGGCDIPTSLPVWETEWELVVARDSVAVSALLPTEITLAEEGFRVDSFIRADSVRLDEVCELCTCFDGPIPELELETQDYELGLPARLVEAPLTRGTAVLELTNGLGFDLLDDGAGNRGFIRTDLVDRRTGDTLVTRVFGESFPDSATVTLEFPLDGVLLHGSLVARVSGFTPGSSCESLSLDPADGLDIRVEIRDVLAPTATIVLNEADLAPDLQRASVPTSLTDRLRPDAADLVLALGVRSALPLPIDLDLSVAASTRELFGAGAALTTPVRIEAGQVGDSEPLLREFVVSPALLQGRDSLVVSGRTTLPAGNLITVTGPESITWDLRLRARVPSR